MKAFFLCLMALTLPLQGNIIETSHFREIIDHVCFNSLVILDIDDTLLIPSQTLGTDVWFIDRIKQHEKNGLLPHAAKEKAISEWEAVRHLTQVQIVEKGTQDVINELQSLRIRVMGLTTQGLALATRTVQQLNSLGIDLTKTSPAQKDRYFLNGHGVLFRHGILFTSGTPKGPALMQLLDLIHYKPRHIIYINDKASHLKDVEASAIDRGIAFTGLRYSYSDARVASYRAEIADIQWEKSTFSRILSDEEAERLLEELTYDFDDFDDFDDAA